jgi:uncharacterized protein YdhG (YjbR/CyaY superfamily)
LSSQIKIVHKQNTDFSSGGKYFMVLTQTIILFLIKQTVSKKFKTMKTIKPKDIDSYIGGFSKDIQKILEEVRSAIRKAAPQAEETIKYDMPTFTLKGNLVSFAAYKNHIGLYPAPAGGEAFEKKLSVYRSGKATVQFPLDQPMPINLITQLVKLCVQKNLEKAERKTKK